MYQEQAMGIAANMAGAAKEMRPSDAAVGAIEKAINCLTEEIGLLENRMSPVLLPDLPSPPTVAGNTSPEPMRCDLVRGMDNVAYTIDQLARRLSSIRSRVGI